jgi:dihydroorotase
MLEYDCAPFGVVGLETALAVVLTELYHKNSIPLIRIVEMLTAGPGRAFSLSRGTLAEGAVADITVFDPDREWEVDPRRFKSKSRNTPFAGRLLRGKVVATFVRGKPVFRDE